LFEADPSKVGWSSDMEHCREICAVSMPSLRPLVVYHCLIRDRRSIPDHNHRDRASRPTGHHLVHTSHAVTIEKLFTSE
jgi:hypothetical protein